LECCLEREELPGRADKLSYLSRHRLMSVSVCSNVPGYTAPVCLISNGSEEELIGRFVDYIEEIQNQATALLLREYEDVMKVLDERFERELEEEDVLDRYGHPINCNAFISRSFYTLKRRFFEHLSCIPVIGFNSGSYDLNIMKGPLLRRLDKPASEDEEEEGEEEEETSSDGKKGIVFVVKKGSRLQCVQTEKFRFLDMMNYVTPGTSYAKYLQTFGAGCAKGFFPYDYVTDLDKLNETSLPPHEAFQNSLTGSNITEEEYRYCLEVWEENGMTTLRDFLVWYNNLDVEPFLVAIQRQFDVYARRGVDMFKDAISIPGVAVKWMFDASSGQPFDIPLIGSRDADLYKTVRENIVGGPSIIFCRHQEKDVTKIRPHVYGEDNAKTCREVLGCDANALYLWSMMRDMPTGSPIRRKSENDFRPTFSDAFGRKAWTWLEYVASRVGTRIEHKFNAGEKLVGKRGLPVDGFCKATNSVYQFHGCLFHGHDCELTRHLSRNPINGVPLEELDEDTRLKDEYIRSLGYDLTTVYECEWDRAKKDDAETKAFVERLEKHTMTRDKKMTEEEIIRAVVNDGFFGMIECDIRVPESLEEKFSEMCPIFKNVEVGREHMSPRMKEYAEQHGLYKKPQRMLIGSLRAEKILLLTPLVKWYLKHGLKITKIHQVVQFIPAKCFEKFGREVTEARREGDLDERKALVAEIMKLIGKSTTHPPSRELPSSKTTRSFFLSPQETPSTVSLSRTKKCTKPSSTRAT
jgi:G:T-mismatch repair DNA endonuclease (very short patch repair protein)